MLSNRRAQSLFRMLFELPHSQRALYLWVATVMQLLFLLGAITISDLSPNQTVFGEVSTGIFFALLIFAFISVLYTAFAYIHYGACLICVYIPSLSERAQRHMRLWEPAISVSYLLFAAPMLVLGTTRIVFFHLDWIPVDVLGYTEESTLVYVFFYIASTAIFLLYKSRDKSKFFRELMGILLACTYVFSGVGGIYTSVMIDSPGLHSDFTTFTDIHGKYIINYDGDYWLTYYTDRNACYKSSTKCDPDWVKTGNASITYSPIPLEPFRDKEVVVHARQLHVAAPISNDNIINKKHLCIGTPINCSFSTGPGVWYRSPLIIKSIRSK